MPQMSGSAKDWLWRAMTAGDLAAVQAIAARVHPAFPEDAAVFAERLRLYPDGCLMLDGNPDPAAYCISHPWRTGDPPALNAELGLLPARPSTYYIHDVALLPDARGSGAAARLVRHLATLARTLRLPTLSLVAVNGSHGFWRRHGFRAVSDAALTARLASYDKAAAYMVRAID